MKKFLKILGLVIITQISIYIYGNHRFKKVESDRIGKVISHGEFNTIGKYNGKHHYALDIKWNEGPFNMSGKREMLSVDYDTWVTTKDNDTITFEAEYYKYKDAGFYIWTLSFNLAMIAVISFAWAVGFIIYLVQISKAKSQE
jgi:hypothetical protein